MSVLLECERCGVQEKTGSVLLFAGFTGPSIPVARPELPDGWSRPVLPREDGSAWHTDLCGRCKAELLAWMAGDVLDPPLLEDPCAPGGSCPCPAGDADCARMAATRGD
jgi:hypothetical protein